MAATRPKDSPKSLSSWSPIATHRRGGFGRGRGPGVAWVPIVRERHTTPRPSGLAGRRESPWKVRPTGSTPVSSTDSIDP